MHQYRQVGYFVYTNASSTHDLDDKMRFNVQSRSSHLSHSE